jgi:nucleoside-diphosphate-sugar epimerase
VKRAFVTGGAGFLGVNLVEQLVSARWEVVVFDTSAPDAAQMEKGSVSFVKGDITDPDSCQRALPVGVDAVFHLAGDTSHWKLADDRQTRGNVEGTRNVVSAALHGKAGRLLHTSSIAAYGFQPTRITEDTRSTALDSSINYFRSKRLAELEVERGGERGLDAVILNPSNILGRHDRSGWSRFFRLIEEGRLPGVPPGRSSFCHVREVAGAHIAAFERGRSGHHYLLGGTDASFLELVQRIGELLGRPTPSRTTPAFLSKLAGRLSLWGSHLTRREPDLTPEKATLLSSELVCSSEKAERELGYRSVPLERMLEDCHRWMLAEGLLGRASSATGGSAEGGRARAPRGDGEEDADAEDRR